MAVAAGVRCAHPDGGVGLKFQAEQWYKPPVWPEEPGAPDKMLHVYVRTTRVLEGHRLGCDVESVSKRWVTPLASHDAMVVTDVRGSAGRDTKS